MGYYEFTINAPDESREAITNKLAEMGSTGFFEKEGKILSYFEKKADIASVCVELALFRDVLKSSGLDPAFSFEYSFLPDMDWNENWKKKFTPIDIGENLTIIPSWLKKDTDRIPVIIDPGMVFGTGYHETSQVCLALIEKISKMDPKDSCLDIGTGSGILAIGAAKLGFRHVTAVDIDPMAIDAATRNADENGLSNVTIKEGDIHSVAGSFDLIVANLLSGILVDIAPEIASRMNPGGKAIVSGMLPGQESDVIAAFVKAGLTLRETFNSGKWVTLLFSR
ncbi:MAG: 50S ribosomal protein L11 methyltransferase [Nitrospirota bacterium]|nr:50S ribosomal protein L11 methyltransferase [Nitrospirota bacterium]